MEREREVNNFVVGDRSCCLYAHFWQIPTLMTHWCLKLLTCTRRTGLDMRPLPAIGHRNMQWGDKIWSALLFCWQHPEKICTHLKLVQEIRPQYFLHAQIWCSRCVFTITVLLLRLRGWKLDNAFKDPFSLSPSIVCMCGYYGQNLLPTSAMVQGYDLIHGANWKKKSFHCELANSVYYSMHKLFPFWLLSR